MTPVVYSFMVEECILAAYTARSVPCPLHADLLLAQIAPDTVSDRFLAIGYSRVRTSIKFSYLEFSCCNVNLIFGGI